MKLLKLKKCRLCKLEVRTINGIRGKYCLNHLVKETLRKQKEKAKEKKVKEKERRVKVREAKRNSISVLKKELDRVFSIYIRKSKANKYGKAICVSCGVSGDWQTMQCGHYNRRSLMSTRWDEKNCHVQCVKCNMFMSGNYPNYTKYLLFNYGAEWIMELVRNGEKIKKWTVEELKNLINYYKARI